MEWLIGKEVIHVSSSDRHKLSVITAIEYGFRTAELTLTSHSSRIEKILVSRVDQRHPEISKMHNLLVLSPQMNVEHSSMTTVCQLKKIVSDYLTRSSTTFNLEQFSSFSIGPLAHFVNELNGCSND